MILKELMLFVISYLGVLLMGFLLIQFLSNGFFTKFIRCKASRGRLTLVKIFAVDNTYFTLGKIDEGFIVFKDRNKESRRLVLERGDVYRAIGVNCIDIDDVTNAIIRPDGTMVDGSDSVKMDHLNVRCLMKPVITNRKDQIKMMLVFIFIIGGLAIIGYMIYNIGVEIGLLKTAITELATVGNV